MNITRSESTPVRPKPLGGMFMFGLIVGIPIIALLSALARRWPEPSLEYWYDITNRGMWLANDWGTMFGNFMEWVAQFVLGMIFTVTPWLALPATLLAIRWLVSNLPNWQLRTAMYAAISTICFMALHLGYHVALLWAGIVPLALLIFWVITTELNWEVEVTNQNEPPAAGPLTPPSAPTLENIPRPPAPIAPAAPVARDIPIEVEN